MENICEPCDYTTKLKSNLTIHFQTVKHIKNMEIFYKQTIEDLIAQKNCDVKEIQILKNEIDNCKLELVLKNQTIQNLNTKIKSLNYTKSVKKQKKTKITDTVIDNKTILDSVYFNKNVSDYDNKNVFYMAYVGTINGEDIYKYGISSQIYARDYKEHRNIFQIFRLFCIEETDNTAKIEKLFEKEMHVRNLHRNLTMDNKKHTELYTTSVEYPLDKIIKLVTDIITNNPLPVIKRANDKIKELTNNSDITKLNLEYQIKLEDTKQKEIQYKMKELEFKTRELELMQ